MSGTWTPIRLSTLPSNIPQLFVKFSFSPAAYTIHLTDLTRLWSESLDRRQIIRRALNENTSIDPSEDTSQLRILLDKIKSALNRDRDTHLQLVQGHNDTELILHTTSPLPPPLHTLQWPIHLSALPPEGLTHELVLPLVDRAYTEKQQIKELIGHLSEKDHVISKLLDRLESSGTDLTTIFPGAAGAKATKKATEREQAARHVRGLGAFNEQQWRNGLKSVKLSRASFGDVVRAVFDDYQRAPDVTDFQISDPEWWSKLHLSPQPELIEISTGGGQSKTDCGKDDDDDRTEDEDDNGFQRQATPPSLKKSTGPEDSTGVRPTQDDDSTDEDDDLDGPSYVTSDRGGRSRIVEAKGHSREHSGPPPSTAPKTVPKKLGTIGGSASKSAKPESRNSGDTAMSLGAQSAGVRHNDILDERSNFHSSTASQPVHKTKLGVIGGKNKTSNHSLQPKDETPVPANHHHLDVDPQPVEESSNNEQTTRPTTRSPARDQNRINTASPANNNLNVASPDMPLESSQEKADRKREELKRQLEAKSQAPAKKKRKF